VRLPRLRLAMTGEEEAGNDRKNDGEKEAGNDIPFSSLRGLSRT